MDQLFRELDEQIHEDDFAKALVTVRKILENAPEDAEAKACELLCLIHSSKFEEAITLLERASDFGGERAFERAYCLYRLDRSDEALAVLQSCEQGVREKQLLAQIKYKRREFAECVKLYEQMLMSKSDDTNRMELFANLAAALAAAEHSESALESYERNKGALEKSYEYIFNIACACVFARDYTRAEELLAIAEAACLKSMEEDGYDEASIASEVAAIRVQQAYVFQLIGRPVQDSIAILEDVLKNKPSRVVAAVAENNYVSLRKDHKLFNAEKKLQACVAPALLPKLSPVQRRTFLFNHLLVMLKMGKTAQCEEELERVRQEYGDDAMPTIVMAALLFRDKKTAEATNLLDEFADRQEMSAESRAAALFCIAQIQASNGKDCTPTLLRLPETERFRPPVVASIVYLLERARKTEQASEVLQHAVAFWTEQHVTSPALARPILVTLLSAAGNFHLKHHMGALAAKFFVGLSKLNDTASAGNVPSLVQALAYEDPALAEKYASELAPVPVPDSINVEQLENVPPPRAKRVVATPADAAQSTSEETVRLKPKKRKKRKKRLPKGYPDCAPPDPERWLPKYMRSTYKPPKGRKVKELRGAQGIGVTTNPTMNESPATAKAETSTKGAVKPQAKAPVKKPVVKKKGGGKKKKK